MVHSDLHILILAGGSGSRFWPRSRHAFPKQFLDLTGQGTLLERTVARVNHLAPRENVWVLTRADLAAKTRAVLPWLAESRLIPEPEGRDTAPCLVLAAARVAREAPDATLLILPADQVIEDTPRFAATVEAALSSLSERDGLLTFGIRPTSPATGYGYIQRRDGEDVVVDGVRISGVASFREKPDLETARRYLATDDFTWNAGIFLWRLATFRAAIVEHAPDLARGWDRLDHLGAAIENTSLPETREAFASLPRISIDYALMEKASNVRVADAAFDWDDLGSWRALERHGKPDGDGNIVDGDVVLLESRDCTIQGAPPRVIAALGLEGLVVIDTPEALLVCPRERVEEVKRLVKSIKDRGWEHVL